MTRYELGKIEVLEEPLVTRLVCKNGLFPTNQTLALKPPVNRAVTYTWHKEHCHDSVLQKHPQEQYFVCSTCGHNIQMPNSNTGK